LKVFDEGSGPLLVVVPGIQGRWEWMRPALRALSARFRVISYSLGAARTMDDLVAQLETVLDRKGVSATAVCGVSFGGLVAVKFAAERPERTTALVIASTPSHTWTPSAVQARYLAHPWLYLPVFLATSPGRMWPEIAAAIPRKSARLRFGLVQAGRVLAAPIKPTQMAARVKLRPGPELPAICARVAAPTLVMTGEPGLDHVVAVSSTLEFVSMIGGARYEMMDRTGHIGLVTQPDRFARIAGDFVNGSSS
jgi:pimeloyl-ACP methyl ester carboxylesterase